MKILCLVLFSLSLQSALANVIKVEEAKIHYYDCAGGVDDLYQVKPGHALIIISGIYRFETSTGTGSNIYEGLPVIGKVENLQKLCAGEGKYSDLTLTLLSDEGSMFELTNIGAK